MDLKFQPASRRQSKLRLGLSGPPGSGKTYTALSVGHCVAAGGRVAVLDTEHGSARKYAGVVSPDGQVFRFDVIELTSFHPETFTKLIRLAERERYDVLIIDSLSHAWTGKDGALDLVEQARKKNRGENSYFAWRDVTPLHNELIDTMLASRLHLIATMRSKMAYDVEEYEEGGRKKARPVKLGLQSIQREGMEYELDIAGDLDAENYLHVTKTRCPALRGRSFHLPGAAFAEIVLDWLDEGEPPSPEDDLRAAIRNVARSEGWGGKVMLPIIQSAAGREATLDVLNLDELTAVMGRVLDLKAANEAGREGGEF